jgi:hypothetical protein
MVIIHGYQTVTTHHRVVVINGICFTGHSITVLNTSRLMGMEQLQLFMNMVFLMEDMVTVSEVFVDWLWQKAFYIFFTHDTLLPFAATYRQVKR